MQLIHHIRHPVPDPIRNSFFVSFIIVLSILTWSLQGNVQKQFDRLHVSTKEVIKIQDAIQIVTSNSSIEQHRIHVLELFNSSNQHTLQAIQLEQVATDLECRIQGMEPTASDLQIQAEVHKRSSDQDSRLALYWSNQSWADNRSAMQLESQAAILAQKSQQEASDAKELLSQAKQDEIQAIQMASNASNILEQTMNATKKDLKGTTGICYWIPQICDLVRRNPELDKWQQATGQSILASSDLQEAFEKQKMADMKRQKGMDLLYQSMVDGNQSSILLVDKDRLKRNEEEDTKRAQDYLAQAHEEADKAYSEQQQANIDQLSIIEWRSQIDMNYQSAKDLFAIAKEEEESAIIEETQLQHEEDLLSTKQNALANARTVSEQYAAAVCWYALYAAVLGSCVLLLLIIRLGQTLHRRRPCQCILPRHGNNFFETLRLNRRLLCYVFCHFLIFLWVLSFAGELLFEYDNHGIFGQLEILILVSTSAGWIQGIFLHFLPHVVYQVWMIQRMSDSNQCDGRQGADYYFYMSNSYILTLLWENVIKRGSLFQCLFFLEVLFVRINTGPAFFKRVYLLNTWWLWIWVLSGFVLHFYYYIQTLPFSSSDRENPEGSSESFEETPSNRSEHLHENTESPRYEGIDDGSASETTSLLTLGTDHTNDSSAPCMGSRSTPSYSLVTIDLSSAGRNRSTGPRSIQRMELSEAISSNFVLNWSIEFQKLESLVLIVTISWTLWIIRIDSLLIQQLGSTSAESFWTKHPIHWIAYLVLVLVFGTIFWTICLAADPTASEFDAEEGEGEAGDRWISAGDFERAWWMLRRPQLCFPSKSRP